MTAVTINTYTRSVTYVADNILKSFKDIIRLSGLNPANLVDSWDSKMRALTTWLNGQYLERVVLEIYNPTTDAFVTGWEMEVVYGWGSGDGNFYVDTEQLKYHIRKQGVAPADAKYRLILFHKSGAPEVEGWSSTTMRSTAGFVRQSLGSTINHNGLGANAAYWRKAG